MRESGGGGSKAGGRGEREKAKLPTATRPSKIGRRKKKKRRPVPSPSKLTQSTGRGPRRSVPLQRRPILRNTRRRECATQPCPAASAGREEQRRHRRCRRCSMSLKKKRRRRRGEQVPRTQGTARGIYRTGSCRGEATRRWPLRGGGRARPPGRRPRKGEEALEKNASLEERESVSRCHFSFFQSTGQQTATMAAVDNNAATKQPAAAPGTVPALASQVRS